MELKKILTLALIGASTLSNAYECKVVEEGRIERITYRRERIVPAKIHLIDSRNVRVNKKTYNTLRKCHNDALSCDAVKVADGYYTDPTMPNHPVLGDFPQWVPAEYEYVVSNKVDNIEDPVVAIYTDSQVINCRQAVSEYLK
jgi:hypothetical protein